MLEKGAKSHTAAASTGKIASPRDHAAIVTPIIPDGSYPYHCRGIASVTSQMSDVTMTYNVVTANAGRFVKVPMVRYRNIAGSRAPAARNAKDEGGEVRQTSSCIESQSHGNRQDQHDEPAEIQPERADPHDLSLHRVP